MKKRKIELLSPARDVSCGIAAINHGADAVYIGGPAFGARAAVANSYSDIEALVGYAHRYSARVYVALNTLLHDHELEAASAQIARFYDMGVDAMIVQDMGLLECDLPPIPFHASTQCNNRSVEKVRFLEDVGFEQVVLARELSLKEIQAIRESTSVSLEFFVHGALCVSYSGQCYISEAMAGRSGNRGECAQFCRHKYVLEDGGGKLIANDYVLSLKDFNASSALERILDAGIDSLKIEGRLKGEGYVKNITAHYRSLLDEIMERRDDLEPTSCGSCSFSFSPDPEKSFNREHTDYYLTKTKHKPASPRTPKALGEFVGTVSSTIKGGFNLKTDKTINNGDGCCYLPEKGDLVGFRVNRAEGDERSTNIFPAKPVSPAKGTRIYRNIDVAFAKDLERSENPRKIAISCALSYHEGELRLTVWDEEGVSSSVVENTPYERAQRLGIAQSTAEKQLQKSGDLPFQMVSVTADLPEDLYLAAATVNAIRRKALEHHLEYRESSYPKREFARTPNSVPWPFEPSYCDNILNEKAVAFYARHGTTPLPLQGVDLKKQTLMHCKYCVRAQYGICSKTKRQNGDTSPLYITDKTGRYKLSFDCEKCEMRVSREG